MTTPARARDPFLPPLLAFALLLRGGLVWLYPDAEGRGDETLHYAIAVLVSHFGLDVVATWAPGNEAVLGLLFRGFGADPAVARTFQAVVSTGTVALVYDLARRSGGVRAGRIAGILCATHPSLVWLPLTLYSETLFLALLLAGVWALVHRREEPEAADRLAAGVLFGLAGLTRAVAVYFLPVWVAWEWWRGGRRAAQQAALVLAAALLVVLPWTLRNAVRFHGFLPIDATMARSVYLAFNRVPFNRDLGLDTAGNQVDRRPRCPSPAIAGREPLPPLEELLKRFPESAVRLAGSPERLRRAVGRARWEAGLDFASIQRCETRRALDFARREPLLVARHVGQRLYAFWGPNSFLLRSVHEGVYRAGPLAPESYSAWKAVLIGYHLVVFSLATLAIFAHPGGRFASFAIPFGLYYTAIHALAVAYSRYRLPLVPLAIVLASVWLAHPALPEGRGRRAALGLALAAFACLCAHYAATVLP